MRVADGSFISRFGEVLSKDKSTDFRWHDLRYTLRSRRGMAGVDITTIAALACGRIADWVFVVLPEVGYLAALGRSTWSNRSSRSSSISSASLPDANQDRIRKEGAEHQTAFGQAQLRIAEKGDRCAIALLSQGNDLAAGFVLLREESVAVVR
jgi:hypothetical protein